MRFLVALAGVAMAAHGSLPAQPLSLTNYNLVSQQTGGNLTQYTYRAELLNSGPAVGGVTARLTGHATVAIRPVPGQDTLQFPAIGANAQASTPGTFSFVAPSGVTVDPGRLQWTFATTPAPPVANAGPNQTVAAGTTVSLDARNSSNPSGVGTLSFAWIFVSRPPGTLTRLMFSTGPTTSFLADVPGTYAVQLTVSNGTLSSTTTVTITAVAGGVLTITDFTPKSAPAGTVITVTGTAFAPLPGNVPGVVLAKQGGGSIGAPLVNFTNTTLSFVIPAGAATGPLSITAGTVTKASSMPLEVTPPSNFSLSAAPAAVDLVRGQSASYVIRLTSGNGFNVSTDLSVTGLPQGVTATFTPAKITAGQFAVLTVKAPATQATGTSNLTVTASASSGGIALSQTVPVALNVRAAATGFIGRTVVSDGEQTPLAGVTVSMLGKDGNGRTTGCSGTAVSDAAGSFSLMNLPPTCVGPQLIGFDGLTVTAPAGKYAGVNLIFTLTAGQVTASPVLVHLPRIDDAETFLVQQNAPTDQTFRYRTIPGLSLVVYAGTVFTMPDGSRPNPFPLVGVEVPVDRLPDNKPNVPTMMRVFIVAFQPANATASQPVAVYYPNTLNNRAGTNMVLMTLDPTRGQMMPYGTGTVSADGTQVVPDPDPARPGRRYGLVNFDWHGQMPPPPDQPNPGPSGGGSGSDSGGPSGGPGGGAGGGSGPGGADGGNGNGGDGNSGDGSAGSGGSGGESGGGGGCEQAINRRVNLLDFPAGDPPEQAGDPVDLYSGIQVIKKVDIAIRGGRGSIAVERTYRSLTTVGGPFGIGTNHNYNFVLDTATAGATINLIMPDGNRYPFAPIPCGTGAWCGWANSALPLFLGARITPVDTGAELRFKNGTVFRFNLVSFAAGLLLSEIRDPNDNRVIISRNPDTTVSTVKDPVGRALVFAYDGAARITSITDPIGRVVRYAYNNQGTLASVTDPAGATTRYGYDANNNMIQVTDPRGFVQAQNTLDAFGRVVKQVRAPGGATLEFAYTPVNPTVRSSQMMEVTVTDSKGVRTTVRFNRNGFVTDKLSTNGERRTYLRGGGDVVIGRKEANAQSTFTYDDLGNLTSATDPTGRRTSFTHEPTHSKIATTTDASGHTSRFSYDSRGNLLSATDANGNTSQYRYDGRGQLTEAIDALGNQRKFSYDSYGNLIALTDPLGATTTFRYDGISRLVATRDPLGRETKRTYDALGRVLTLTDARGGVTVFAYDPNGNLLSLRDPQANLTTYTYDEMNRVATRTDALGATDTRTYDSNGNLIRFVDRAGKVSSFEYDNLNRRVRETYEDARVDRLYDVQGRLIRITDTAVGVFERRYDTAGRLLADKTPFASVEYSYDARGLMASRRVAGQNTLTYSYDPAGNLTGLALPPLSASRTYDALNRVRSLNRGNGVVTSYSYNAAGRITSLLHTRGSSLLGSQVYSYDLSGVRVGLESSFGGPLKTRPYSAKYNRGNQQTERGVDATKFDPVGNAASSGSRSYAWDARGRLRSVAAGGQVMDFTYDHDGHLLRAKAKNGSKVSTYVLDDLTNIAHVSIDGWREVPVLAGRTMDDHIGVSSAGVEYGIQDAVGSTVMSLDGNGIPRSAFIYEPFGEYSGTGDYLFRFTGRIATDDQLQYHRARFYDSLASRFLSEDQVGRSESVNLYRYADNNPIEFVDRDGRLAEKVDPVQLQIGAGLLLAYGRNILLNASGKILLAGDLAATLIPPFAGILPNTWQTALAYFVLKACTGDLGVGGTEGCRAAYELFSGKTILADGIADLLDLKRGDRGNGRRCQ